MSKVTCIVNRQRIAYGDRRRASMDTLAIVVELKSIGLEEQGSKSRESRSPMAIVRAELARTIYSGRKEIIVCRFTIHKLSAN